MKGIGVALLMRAPGGSGRATMENGSTTGIGKANEDVWSTVTGGITTMSATTGGTTITRTTVTATIAKTTTEIRQTIAGVAAKQSAATGAQVSKSNGRHRAQSLPPVPIFLLTLPGNSQSAQGFAAR